MFASKTPRDLNRDPRPLSTIGTGRRVRVGSDYAGETVTNPRPEFDHPQNNEPNVILSGIRYLVRDSVHRDLAAYYADAARYLTGGTHALGAPILPGMADHARRVLTRLAQMEPRA